MSEPELRTNVMKKVKDYEELIANLKISRPRIQRYERHDSTKAHRIVIKQAQHMYELRMESQTL